MPIVTRVRKEPSGLGSAMHEHIAGVCTTENLYYTRGQVVARLRQGETWITQANGQTARIREIRFCPRAGCIANPYITTRADDSLDNNLENLPRC